MSEEIDISPIENFVNAWKAKYDGRDPKLDNYIHFQELNCFHNWYPYLVDAGIPTPETLMVPTPWMLTGKREYRLGCIADMPSQAAASAEVGNEVWAGHVDFADRIKGCMIRLVGDTNPAFLRGPSFSGKFRWHDCCYVLSRDTTQILEHVMNITWSHLEADNAPVDESWAVREYLTPSMPMQTDNIPICREFRYFIDLEKHKVIGRANYWPAKAFEQQLGRPDLYEDYYAPKEIDKEADAIAKQAAERMFKFPKQGRDVSEHLWSLDLMLTEEKGWVAVDMALAIRSAHNEILLEHGYVEEKGDDDE